MRAGILKIQGTDPDATAEMLRRQGWSVYRLPPGISDKSEFFDAIRVHLPLDPSLIGSYSWDALSDSVWGGLHSLEATRIAIVWPDDAWQGGADHETAYRVLEDVVALLGDARAANGRPKEVAIVIV